MSSGSLSIAAHEAIETFTKKERTQRPGLFLLWSEDHDHLSTFHLRLLLDDADRGQVGLDATQQIEPELTAQAFAGGWLRTGDLGYLVDGDIFICGRAKELIIVNGRNYYPQDLEWEASRVDGVRKGNVIAFGTRKPLNDRERVVIAFETSRPHDQREGLKQEVRKAVRNASGLSVDDVVALDAGVLPKTSSGKLKRNETRRLYEVGELFVRSSARQGDAWETAKEIAKSQFGYVRSIFDKG